MDIGSAFTFAFDDEDWIKKIGIGGGLNFLAIFIVPVFFILGYMLDTLKNVRDGQATPLPEWSNLGELFMKGLMVFVIGLIYNIIPILIIACPLAIVPLVASDPDSAETVGLIVNCLSCIGGLIALVFNLILPSALIRYAQSESLGSAFEFGAIFSFITANVGEYLIAVLLSWVAGFVASFGIILCLVGVYFTNFWAVLVAANLYGQLARKA